MTGRASVFDATAAELQERSGLESLAARGTLRLALKSAGLDAKTVSPEEMAVAVERLLPDELGPRGVEDASGVCAALAAAVRAKAGTFDGAPEADSPERIFRRMREGPGKGS